VEFSHRDVTVQSGSKLIRVDIISSSLPPQFRALESINSLEQIYLDAWLRAEQNYEVLHLLEKRVAARRHIPQQLLPLEQKLYIK